MISYGQQIELCVEVMVVKKKVTIVLGIISIVAISTMIMFSICRRELCRVLKLGNVIEEKI